MNTYDLVVIGTGPAGFRAAIQAAKSGKNVAVCERREIVGGVSVSTGTIPSKTLREAVLFLTGYQYRGIYGSSFTVKDEITIEDLAFRVQLMIKREAALFEDQLRRNGVKLLQGEASFLDANRLRVVGSESSVEVQSEFIVIATGSVAAEPPGAMIDGEKIILSDHISQLKKLPKSLTVVGAGVIGIEYASMFAALGVEVTVIDKRDRLLEFVDHEISDALVYHMRNNECSFRFEEEVDTVELSDSGKAVAKLQSGKTIVSDVLLYSIGRKGATESLNLEAVGIPVDDRGRLTVDEQFRTTIPHIYAAGDVIGFPALAATSMMQGRAAVCHAFAVEDLALPKFFPYGVYSVPEISMVGRTEEELTEAAVPYEVGIARYREIARGGMIGDDHGLLKLIFSRPEGTLLGVHVIGSSATELVHIGQAVMYYNGGIDYFINNVFNYPTFAECYKVAAYDAYNKLNELS